MNEEALLVIIFIIVAIGVAAYVMIQNNRVRKRYLLEQIQKGWGAVPDREYSYEELESIARYGERIRGDQFYIDDTTWNDLDLLRVFQLLNKYHVVLWRGLSICNAQDSAF